MPLTPKQVYDSKERLNKAFAYFDEQLTRFGGSLMDAEPKNRVLTCLPTDGFPSLSKEEWEIVKGVYTKAGWSVAVDHDHDFFRYQISFRDVGAKPAPDSRFRNVIMERKEQMDERDKKRKYLRLSPELGDGQHWTFADGPDLAAKALEGFFAEGAPGESCSIEIVEMSDYEMGKLPYV